MKKLLSVLLSCLLCLSLVGCSGGGTTPSDSDKKTYTVGICQLVQHVALDAATQGFRDALTAEFGDAVTFIPHNASGEPANCTVICNNLVSDQVDLILANATPALQAAANATTTIPVLGTAISAYSVALDIDNFTGVTGRNISGTSDLAPLDVQAQMILDLFPEAKTVGLLYCSGEANSLYQIEVVEAYLKNKGVATERFSFSNSTDVALVTQDACSRSDVLYIPTDNTAANCADLIGSVVKEANTPVIAGEEGICASCGVATLTIDYYELGVLTGKMAAKILKGEAKVEEMEIQYYDHPVFKYNPTLASYYGVTIPDNYEPMQ